MRLDKPVKKKKSPKKLLQRKRKDITTGKAREVFSKSVMRRLVSTKYNPENIAQFKPGEQLHKYLLDRTEDYKSFVRSFPCFVPRCGKPSRAHHVEVNGIATKGSDYSCVNLCDEHHTIGPEAVHNVGSTVFEYKCNVDLKDQQIQLLREYIRRLTNEAPNCTGLCV
jgi:hypothetical protein